MAAGAVQNYQWDPARLLSARDTPGCAVIVLNCAVGNTKLVSTVYQNGHRLHAPIVGRKVELTQHSKTQGGCRRWCQHHPRREYWLGRGEAARTGTHHRYLSDLTSLCVFRLMHGQYYQPPDIITGDFDSIRPAVLEQYSDAGSTIIQDIDKYATDFTKAIRAVNARAAGAELEAVVVFGGLGGRVDQAFAQLHQLLMHEGELRPLDLFLVAGASVVLVLRPGRNVVRTRRAEGSGLGRNVGIIPLGRPAVISTEGLQWDVRDWPTSFETQVSTSNYVVADDVVVVTDERVLFSIDIEREGNEA